MAITATFVAADQFTVTGDRTAHLKPGLRIQALMGIDGTVEGTVESSSYSAITDLTTCTIEESVLTANLATIKRGATYADIGSSSGNIGKHGHTGADDGGLMVAAGMSEAQRDILDRLPIPGTGDAGKPVVINETEDGYTTGSAVFAVPTGTGFTHITAGAQDAAAKMVVDADVDPVAAIAESKLSLAYGTSALNTAVGTAQSTANTAVSNAATAQSTADSAVSAAAAAQATANAAIPATEKGAASGVATLTVAQKVVQDPDSATATSTASKIPIADATGKLDGWISDADATTKGKIQLAGQLSGTAASPTVVGIKESGGQALTIGAIADGQFLARSTTTIVGAAGTGSGIPATTVTNETAWGVTPAVGSSTNYAREDHTHGTPAEPSSGGGPAPDYTPPSMKWKDINEVTLPIGRYYKAGHRLDGQYQDTTNMSSYWDLAAAVNVDVDAPGTMIGGDVISSWYSLWMTSASTFLVLPYIRVDAIAYSAPNTVINPADHADGTTANNNFVSANDCFNTYRLMQLCDTTYHGTIHTIADSVDGTPDQILITGDVTAQIAATEWLQMIPPSGAACLYLGDIGFDASGNLIEFDMPGKWTYSYSPYIQINGNLHATDYANTDLGLAVPPTAKEVQFVLNAGSGGTSAQGVQISVAWRGASNTEWWSMTLSSDGSVVPQFRKSQSVWAPLQIKSKIRNMIRIDIGTSWIAATYGDFRVYGFKT